MTTIFRVALVLLAIGLSGCADQNYIPDAARPQAVQAVSVPHPVEIEKAGEQYVTIFTTILDAGTWGVESDDGRGVWPMMSERQGPKPRVGYAFVTDVNFWGDITLETVLVGRISEIGNEKIINLDRYGGKIHNPTGKEFEYSPKRFDSDPAYAHKIFQKGMTIQEIQAFWQMYTEKRGVALDKKSFREIRVGSPEWDEFKVQLAEHMGNNYKMPDGEIRQGYLSTSEFKKQAAKNEGVTNGQRFARNLHFNLGAPDLGVLSSILNGLIDASSGPIEGFYARAECLRGDLKPNFRLMQDIYKNLLNQRDVIIAELQQKQAQ